MTIRYWTDDGVSIIREFDEKGCCSLCGQYHGENDLCCIASAIDRAVEREREACAKLVCDFRLLRATSHEEMARDAEIANAIGNPKASRAVGGAVGANPIALIVGCHRVLGASGKITGFSGGDGLPTKRWLLALEGLKAKE